MRPLLFFAITFISISCFSQENKITYEIDTIRLTPPSEAKLAAFEINGVMIVVSYLDLLDVFKRVKKSQFRDGKKNLNACISYINKMSAKQDTVYLTSLIEKNLDMGQAYVFFCRKLNVGKAIVISADKKVHSSIIREKSTYHGGMLSSWGSSQYYLIKSKNYFLKIFDWRS